MLGVSVQIESFQFFIFCHNHETSRRMIINRLGFVFSGWFCKQAFFMRFMFCRNHSITERSFFILSFFFFAMGIHMSWVKSMVLKPFKHIGFLLKHSDNASKFYIFNKASDSPNFSRHD
ncbi:uncharacterized protein B0P05DRAFT_4920 [Gilbertella persicaria]|uniref:uncharacterized protein n=1 Tax=Gilbertella persicaria TaxID=101096 RepID=UPI0022203B4B|nr:uncharacterized protein B0P05DRAFT_4920 [Gilbertella persicaria]KAI8098268.1 hypothetical protein B0P05DRAFT_4920 [Gilbertella persicaria]